MVSGSQQCWEVTGSSTFFRRSWSYLPPLLLLHKKLHPALLLSDDRDFHTRRLPPPPPRANSMAAAAAAARQPELRRLLRGHIVSKRIGSSSVPLCTGCTKHDLVYVPTDDWLAFDGKLFFATTFLHRKSSTNVFAKDLFFCWIWKISFDYFKASQLIALFTTKTKYETIKGTVYLGS